jgi:hypothetical protein
MLIYINVSYPDAPTLSDQPHLCRTTASRGMSSSAFSGGCHEAESSFD